MSGNTGGESIGQATDAEIAAPAWKNLYRVSGAAALILFVLFLIGISGVIIAGTQPDSQNGWLSPFQNNWLVVLFKINAGFSGVQSDLLAVLNLLDLVIMALFGAMVLALYAALRSTYRIWAVVAASLPFLGIVVFLITGTAGRSGLLLAGLIISALMLRSRDFSLVTAYVGLVASALLFSGDIGTAVVASSTVIAIFIGIGYVLWMIWLFLIARRLIQL
jgi:hypothetical protein